jgi:hypothetical protein
MNLPTHAIPRSSHTPEHAALLAETALPVGCLTWCHQHFQWMSSSLMSRKHTSSLWMLRSCSGVALG